MTASASTTENDPRLGSTLAGRYTLVAPLGAGSMGTVYRATQLAIDRDVAVKIVSGDKSFDPAANARFMREARANSLLASPHTVQVLDFGQSETGELFLVMELLEGESLRRRLARIGRFPADVAIETCLGALRSLSEAHAKGVIHRDLKPEHLFFARVKGGEKQHDEIVKVLDFGVAKLIGDEHKRHNAVETRDGRILGTPRYMSPEQAQAKPLDARSDLYSVGVILYEMLTGRPPFTSDDPIIVMAQHITKTPRLPSEVCPEACVPDDLETIVMRALSKQPSGRPANAEAMTEQLTMLLESGLAGVAGVRRGARISVAPKSGVNGPGGVGTSGGVVVTRVPEAETFPTGDVMADVEPETLEMRSGRRRRGPVVALALALVIGATVAAVLMQRGPSGASAVAPPASSSLPSVAMATATAASTNTTLSVPSVVPIDALPTAAPPPAVPGSGSRRPGAKPPAPPPRAGQPPRAKGYDYLE